MADALAQERRDLGHLLKSVVKVISVSDSPDYEQPWQTKGAETGSGSGSIVQTPRGPRVLTNAHCVENHVYVEVRRYGNSRKYAAGVEAIGHECDLALLEVEDESFFAGTTAIELGELPELSDRVSVCGYPIGGERLSITQGIVSRIDVIRYAQSQRKLLAVQIDAAINPGNSGGPVLQDGRLVGVAFQALDDAENIGYVIASPVVRHFLEDVDHGIYEGFPSLGARTQPLESPAHRASLGMPGDYEHGVLVTRVGHGSSASELLRPGDVLLEVDGMPVMVDGTVALRDGEFVDFAYAVARRHVGEAVPVKLWREGAELACVVPMRPPRRLVPEARYDVEPTYYVFGGLLFVPLTRNYLETWGDSWSQHAPRALMVLYEEGLRTRDRQEVVIVQKVLADRVNQGYHDLESLVVERVQGVPVRSLTHLIDEVEATDTPFVNFELTLGRHVVIDRALAAQRHGPILERFGVPEDRSDDLVAPETEEEEWDEAEAGEPEADAAPVGVMPPVACGAERR